MSANGKSPDKLKILICLLYYLPHRTGMQLYIQRVSEALLLEAYMERRRGFYAAIVLRDPTQRKFANGWRNRRNSLRQMIGLEPEEP